MSSKNCKIVATVHANGKCLYIHWNPIEWTHASLKYGECLEPVRENDGLFCSWEEDIWTFVDNGRKRIVEEYKQRQKCLKDNYKRFRDLRTHMNEREFESRFPYVPRPFASIAATAEEETPFDFDNEPLIAMEGSIECSCSEDTILGIEVCPVCGPVSLQSAEEVDPGEETDECETEDKSKLLSLAAPLQRIKTPEFTKRPLSPGY